MLACLNIDTTSSQWSQRQNPKDQWNLPRSCTGGSIYQRLTRSLLILSLLFMSKQRVSHLGRNPFIKPSTLSRPWFDHSDSLELNLRNIFSISFCMLIHANIVTNIILDVIKVFEWRKWGGTITKISESQHLTLYHTISHNNPLSFTGCNTKKAPFRYKANVRKGCVTFFSCLSLKSNLY